MAKKKRNPPESAAALTDRLETLLHTVRCIAQHEDELCTLLHEARSSGKLSGESAADLRNILEGLPAEEYAWQLHAVAIDLDNTLDAAA